MASVSARRPVWLLSMDSGQFCSPPLTTGALLSYYRVHGRTQAETEVHLVHFIYEDDLRVFRREALGTICAEAALASARGVRPVFGFSCYTWNTDLFCEVMQAIRALCPDVLIIAGGPQVQKPEDYLGRFPIDVIVQGEGEITFQQWLDVAEQPERWPEVSGLSYLKDGCVVRTAGRPRSTNLDEFPSAFDVVELRDDVGKPRYTQIAYETSRGCPFRCAYCEWGTGAIGTKMIQFSLERIQVDLERAIAGGVQDIWLCDSNFGALKEDLAKAQVICALRQRTGRPYTFATSWSKAHSPRVQQIVLLLQRHGLLQNYNLALQTLTPLALKLSRRTNMRSNRYEPIAKAMTREGVPITTELIWGLPGDNLPEFERNLDRLLTFFPNINIFGYTLLPGTEFYERREEYQLQTIPVAGYGQAKGEYVIGSHTFDREQGIEGYYLITGHILFIRGHIFPFTLRLLALNGSVPVSPLLRAVLGALVVDVQADFPALDLSDRMVVYEHRAALYLSFIARHRVTFETIAETVFAWLERHGAAENLRRWVACTLQLDEALCPRGGPTRVEDVVFDFDARAVEAALGRMELPTVEAFAEQVQVAQVKHPAHVGEVVKDPDGGSWMRGRFCDDVALATPLAAHLP